MKVIVSVALWGRRYAETFLRYGLASQLSPNNIPLLIDRHRVTYHIVTTRRDADWMRAQPNFERLLACCEVIWDIIEDLGFNLTQIPAGMDGDKYPFLSRLQNVAFERSLEHDVLVFNYADFIWADGALCHSIDLMQKGVDAVLGFCPPVDVKQGRRALDTLRHAGDASGTLTVPPRVGVGIAVDYLHAEAALRLWDGPRFSSMPTYVIWQVADEGLLVRAYHQTVLALRVNSDDPLYCGGIRRGSLDGYFTAELAGRNTVAFADNSDQVLVFSLYESSAYSGVPASERTDALKNCLRVSVSQGQRRFAEVPLLFKRKYSDTQRWETACRRSWESLSKVHDQVPADWMAFVDEQSTYGEIGALERRWRGAANARTLFYRHALAGRLSGRLGRVTKHVLGPGRARTWRLKFEAWLFGDPTRL